MSSAKRHLILGTAGHIDHGKTELVRALTGVDTDRLDEEKERGITIDLGFAELTDEELQLGVVDVPGHEGFVRNMLAGATGMDVVLLVVAADEGVMPQTREHLAIVRLLGVKHLVVALTKVDLVEDAWLELVREEVRELLADTRFAQAPLLATSARSGQGIDALARTLAETASGSRPDRADDVARLPVDRVFTVRGTGTVVTGTLWSGVLHDGQQVRIRPGGPEARIRSIEVHGQPVEQAVAGQRTAVALAGTGVDRDAVRRGHVVLDEESWPVTTMLTTRLHLLPRHERPVEHNQRVRIHLGTAEVMARVILLDGDGLLFPGASTWSQLRLESPAVARAREPFVVRSYSPMTTIGGGVVAEPDPPKRTRLDSDTIDLLTELLEGSPAEAVAAAASLHGLSGVGRGVLPVLTGLSPGRVEAGLREMEVDGGVVLAEVAFAPTVVRDGEEKLLAALEEHHRRAPLRPGVPLESLRAALPRGRHPELPETVLHRLEARGALVVRDDLAARPDFEPTPSDEQERARRRLLDLYRDSGLTPPSVDELPEELRDRPDLWPLLKLLEHQGRLTPLDEDLFASTDALEQLASVVRNDLGGQDGLGPADFRDVIPVSRKHLIPLLGYLDRTGVTIRREGGREVLAHDR